MAGFNEFKALEAATQIVAAAASANSLKLKGSPGDAQFSEQNGKADGTYIATLIKTIAAGIKSE